MSGESRISTRPSDERALELLGRVRLAFVSFSYVTSGVVVCVSADPGSARQDTESDVLPGESCREIARYMSGRTPVRVVASLSADSRQLLVEARARIGGRDLHRVIVKMEV